MKHLILATLVALTLNAPAIAEEACTPNNMATRILQSANPNDLHPDWTGENRIGLSWALFVDGEETDAVDDSVTYISGSLVDSKGNAAGDVYGIKAEWTCS